VNHEYSTLPGVKDSMLDIMLNLKSLIIDKKTPDIEWIKLSKNKAGKVTA
jgi:DNA-directed RNA polymerase alpha subunit